MTDKNDRDNLVDLKDFQKRKTQQAREEARTKARQGGANLLSSRGAQKLVLALFFLAILWLAMPQNFVASIMQAFGGSAGR